MTLLVTAAIAKDVTIMIVVPFASLLEYIEICRPLCHIQYKIAFSGETDWKMDQVRRDHTIAFQEPFIDAAIY